MKYKKGDMVFIRTDLIPDKYYAMDGGPSTCYMASDMLHYAGMRACVKQARSNGYILSLQDGTFVIERWRWVDEMLCDEDPNRVDCDGIASEEELDLFLDFCIK